MLSFFVKFWKWKNIFLNIPSYPPPIAVRISLTNQFYQKKIMFLYIFNNNKKVQNWNVEKGPGKNLSLFLYLWKYTEMSIFLIKFIGQWIPDGEGQGIANDIKKKYFIFKTRQNRVTKFGQLKSWNVEKGPSFVNFPNFVTIFVKFWKLFFFDNPSHPPPIAVRNSLTNQFYQNN